MKKLLLSLVTLFISSFCFSQTPIKRIYPNPYGFIGSIIKPTPDHGYFFLNVEANTFEPHLVKTDSTGNIQWSVKLNLSAVQDILPEADGSFLVMSLRNLIKLDASGHILWQRQFSYKNNYFSKIKKDIRGDGYLLMANVEEGFVILKVDNSGHVVWMQYMNYTYGLGHGDFVQSRKDSCLYKVSAAYKAMFLTKFDKDGKGMWTKEISKAAADGLIFGIEIKETFQNNFVVGFSSQTEFTFVSVDINGNVLSPTQMLSYPSKSLFFWDLAHEDPQNSILFTVLSEPFIQYPVSRHIVVGKTNLSGNINWVKKVGVKNRESAADIESDGKFVTLLATHFDTLEQKSFVKFIKSNEAEEFCDAENFAYPAVSSTSFTSKAITNCSYKYDFPIEMETTNWFTEYLNDFNYIDCYETERDNIDGITIYPNPFTFQTTLAFEDMQYQSKIQLFDVFGRQVIEMEFTGKQLTLQTPDSAPGLYFIHITGADNHVVIKKVIIQ